MGEEDIKAFVTFKDGQSVSDDDLKDFCVAKLTKFMVPRHFTILEDMPRTPTGKPEKGKLAMM